MTPAIRLFLSERAASYVDRSLRAEKLVSVIPLQRRHRLIAAARQRSERGSDHLSPWNFVPPRQKFGFPSHRQFLPELCHVAPLCTRAPAGSIRNYTNGGALGRRDRRRDDICLLVCGNIGYGIQKLEYDCERADDRGRCIDIQSLSAGSAVRRPRNCFR